MRAEVTRHLVVRAGRVLVPDLPVRDGRLWPVVHRLRDLSQLDLPDTVELAEDDVVAPHEAAERRQERSRERLLAQLHRGGLRDEPADPPLVGCVEPLHRSSHKI